VTVEAAITAVSGSIVRRFHASRMLAVFRGVGERAMKIKISKLVREMPPSGIRAFFDLVLGMEDVISLGVGEPDFDTPWHIRETGIYSLEKGYSSYTSNKGLRELRDTIADFLQRRHGMRYDPDDEILVTVGVSEALDLAMRALLERGE
jgi:aminotransferase